MTRPIPLRAAIPTALALLATALTVSMVAYEARVTRTAIETSAAERGVSLGNLAVPIVERALLQGHGGEADDEVSRLSLVPDVSSVLVIGEEGQILHASDFGVRGQPLRTTAFAGFGETVTRALASKSPLVRETADGVSLVVALPLHAEMRVGEFNPRRKAVLLLAVDISAPWHAELRQIGLLALLMGGVGVAAGLATWWYLRTSFTRQFDQLQERVARYAAGDEATRAPEHGNGELSEIGRVLNRLFADLAAQRGAQRESEEKFRRLFENAPLLMSVSTLETGQIVEVNEAFVRVSGYSRDELLSMSSMDLEWSDTTKRLRMLHRLGERGRVDEVETQLRTKDGHRLDCVFHAERITLGGKPMLLAIVQEVTARKEMEATLRRSEAMFRAVIDGSNDGIAFADEHASVLYLSPSALAMCGDSDASVGRSVFHGIHREDAGRVQAAWRSLLRSPGGMMSVVYRRRHRDGSWRHVETTAHNLLHDANARIVVLTSRDMTERRRADEDQRRLERLLVRAQRLEAVGTLAGSVAHDFNNILTAMSVNLDVLLEVEGLSDTLRNGLRELRSESDRASALTRQLLLLSRPETMEVPLPAGQMDTTEAPSASTSDRAPGHGEGILLVEDDDAIRRLLAPALQQAGYAVTVASNGPEAMERWQRESGRFDLLVTDIVMPGSMDGLELSHLLLGDRPSLKVILMTGYSPDLARSDLLTRQGVYFISKPLDTRTLLATVHEALRSRE